MAFVTNFEEDQRRLYKEEVSDNYDISNDMLTDSTGGMKTEVENNMTQVMSAASNLKKRKATYDFKTKNKSFLKLYNTLYNLGIKNNKFFLKIYDRDLIGVDVYGSVLPLDLQMKVLLEVITNPWYFLREICRIPADGMPIEPGGGTEFLADRNNIASWYCFLNGIDHYDSKSRQLGKTQGAISELNYAFHYGAIAATFLFFNKEFTLSKTNLYRLKCQRDMLPRWLQMRLNYKEDGSIDKGTDSMTTLKNPITNNIIKVMPRATSKESAIKLGRGDTAAFHYMDELDFTPYNTDIMDAAAFSYATASKNAANNHSLYGRIFTSTPGYLNTAAGKSADKLIKRMLVWDDSFYDVPINKLKSILASNKNNGIMYIEHSWKQLGKPIAWYEHQCKLVDYKPDIILREIELKRIQGNDASPFKQQNLVYISNNTKNPIEKLDLNNDLMPILIYEKINMKIHYILSIDPAEGLGQNNNAFVLINPHNGMPVAEYKSPYISPEALFNMICRFMDNYCPNALLVIEANRGRELINRFRESMYRHRLWYNDDKLTDKITVTNDPYGQQKMQAMQRRACGFDTTAKSKPLLFSIIERMMEEELDKVCLQYLVKDISSVQRKPNGKIIMGAGMDDDEEEGVGHGDVLMAFLIGTFVLLNDKKLEKYGIRKGSSEPKLTSEMTDAEKKVYISNAIGNMPPELQALFADALRETNPLEESQNYAKEVQFAMQSANQAFSGEEAYEGSVDDNLMQDSMWKQIDENMFQSRDDYRKNNQFNINDWID